MKCKQPIGSICYIDFLLIKSFIHHGIAAVKHNTSKCYTLSLFTILVVLLFGFTAPKVRAGEYRHHEAHEHGVAHMNVAVEGDSLYIEFTSPAANIVGFEHSPRTPKQKAAVEKAVETLKSGQALFALPTEAEGRLAESKVETDITGDTDHENESGHTHAQGETGKGAGEDMHHHEDNHQYQEHERHSEFKGTYRFVCKKIDKLSYMDVMLIRIFPGIEHIEVQLLTGTGQTALELTEKKNKIVF